MKKNPGTLKVLALFNLTMVVVAMVLAVKYYGWILALIIFLMAWSSNLDRRIKELTRWSL